MTSMATSIFHKDGSFAIWMPGPVIKNQYVDFIHCFEVDTLAEDAEIYLSVDSEYALFLNGEFVDCGQYDDYPEHKGYDCLPVAGKLKTGENRLCIRAYFQGEDSMQYVTGVPMLVYSLKNGEQTIVSDPETSICRLVNAYESGEQVDRFTIQVSFSFHYDAEKEDHWLSADYVPGEEWVKPVEQKGVLDTIDFYRRPVKKQLFGQPVPVWFAAQGLLRYDPNEAGTLGNRMQTAFLSAREERFVFSNLPKQALYQEKPIRFPGVVKTREGLDSIYLLLDLQDPAAGLFHLEVDAAAGTAVDVAYGEHLEDLRVRASVGGRSYAFSYVCKEGLQTFTHYFRRVGGRYLQLHIHQMKRPVTLFYAGIVPMNYPVRVSGELDCGDRLFNEILSGCDRTLQLCMHEHYEDCPWREQGLYTMDSRNQMLSGYYMYDNSDFALASLQLSADHIRPDGLLQNCSPCSWPTTMPSFSMEWILSLRDFVLHTGRIGDAMMLLDQAKSVLQSVAKTFDGTLLTAPVNDTIWNFYEWVDGLDDYDGLFQNRTKFHQYDGPLNALFCLAMKAMRQLLDWGNETWTEMDIIEKTIRSNFQKMFWNEEKGYLCSYNDYGDQNGAHELMQSWSLLAELVPQQLQTKLRRRLASGDGSITPSTLSFLVFKYEALLQEEQFAGVVFEDIANKWGKMLMSGSRTFWETIHGAYDFENAGSLCHGWAGIPAYFLYAYYLGVRPTEPGYSSYIVAPVSMGQAASGKVYTPVGDIHVVVDHGTFSARLEPASERCIVN